MDYYDDCSSVIVLDLGVVMKNICLLGASGSIGTQTLDVLYQHQDKFNLVAFSVGSNIEVANQILANFKQVKYVCVSNREDITKLNITDQEVLSGSDGLLELIVMKEVDTVVNSLIGFVGLEPTIRAIKANKDICLANKETLVTAGDIVMPLVKECGVNLIPIDSEHSAIMQALMGNNVEDVNRIILTASGGSFRDLTLEELENVTLEQTLNHPNWSMGIGITIDSATMFNKALEIIEAHHLYNIDYDKIEVMIHYESINHSMVEYIDGSVMAQLSFPDMRIPIALSLSYPRRIKLDVKKDIMQMEKMSFKPVDLDRFKAIKIAYAVGKAGYTYPTVLNASKEVANQLFIDGIIKFIDIEKVVIWALKNHQVINNPSIEDILNTDKLTRKQVLEKWS